MTSAKTGENVEDGFLSLARTLVLQRDMEAKLASAKSEPIVAGDIIGVADRIMVDFCNDFGGIEAGTPIIREQFSRAGVDINAPTIEGLLMAINLLAGVESSFKSKEDVEKSRTRRMG